MRLKEIISKFYEVGFVANEKQLFSLVETSENGFVFPSHPITIHNQTHMKYIFPILKVLLQ